MPHDTTGLPAGYEYCNSNAFDAHNGPYYDRWSVDAQGRRRYSIAVRIAAHHIGQQNRVHGGFILALLDQVMGLRSFDALSAPAFTISLQSAFVGPAHEHRWIEAHAWPTATTRSFAFISAEVWQGDAMVATANGVWRIARPKQPQGAAA